MCIRDRSLCENYRGINLLNTAYKLYAKIINNILKPLAEVVLLEEENAFRKGRSTIHNVTIVKQITEKQREHNLETHPAFIDYDKAFDRGNRDILWKILEIRGYPLHLIRVNYLYDGTPVVIRTEEGRLTQ